MDRIIITVKEQQSRMEFDLEVPTNVVIEQLFDDIIQTILGAQPTLSIEESRSKLVTVNGRELGEMKTLDEEGIKNGAVLHIVMR